MPGRGLNRRVLALGGALLVAALGSYLIVDQDAALRARAIAGARSDPLPAATARTTPHATSSASPGQAAPPGQRANGVPADPAAEVTGLLTARGQAVTSRSSAAWLATLDPRATAFRAAQRQVFTALTALRPHAWSYRFAGASPLTPAQAAVRPGGWVAAVDLDYQIVPGGPVAVRTQYLTMVPAGPGELGPWRIAADTAGATERDLWDLVPITVTKMSRCVVIAAQGQDGLAARVARTCRAAAERVDGVWGRGWPVRTVLIVPGSQKQLGVLLGRTTQASTSGKTDGLDETAAVTTGPASGPAEEVLINPAVFTGLQAIGYRVILTHELVHVATRATGSRNAPTWLSEGFADYVGYSGTGLSARDIAPEALDQVRQGRIPKTFPPDGDFDASRSTAAAAYGFAWAAAGTIADSGGTKTLVAFYRAAAVPSGATPARVDHAVRTVLKLHGTAVLVARWQQHLEELAR